MDVRTGLFYLFSVVLLFAVNVVATELYSVFVPQRMS